MEFPQRQHQIAFVSGQVLPILQGASFPGGEPEHVHLVVTSRMKDKAKRLADILKNKGQKVCPYPLLGMHQQPVVDILEVIRQKCGAENLSLNLTGGTKLMALAASEWAYIYDIPVFYVDTDQEELILLGQNWEYKPLPSILDVQNILNGQGYVIESFSDEPVPKERREIFPGLLELSCRNPVLLRRLNAVAQQAKVAPWVVPDQGPDSPAWGEMLTLCASVGMLQRGAGHIAFPSEEARKWCGGLWFEEYVQSVLCKLKWDKVINSWAASVEVRQDGVPNELDALFTARNRLFTIECKTAKLSKAGKVSQGRHPEEEKGASFLYKADSLQSRLGGLLAGSLICSVTSLEPHDRLRAEKLGIKIICGLDMLSLSDRLKEWIATA